MPRRARPTRPAPGEGTILYQKPIVAMLASFDMTPAEFTAMVRRGDLWDGPTDDCRFDTEGREERLPSGFPATKGVITWRRRTKTWSMDVQHMILKTGETQWLSSHYWGVTDSGLAQARFDGIDMPQTAAIELIGRSLADIVVHPWLAMPDLIVRNVSASGRATSFKGAVAEIGRPMLELQFDVPTEMHPDAI